MTKLHFNSCSYLQKLQNAFGYSGHVTHFPDSLSMSSLPSTKYRRVHKSFPHDRDGEHILIYTSVTDSRSWAICPLHGFHSLPRVCLNAL